jgi:hypothetical protein
MLALLPLLGPCRSHSTLHITTAGWLMQHLRCTCHNTLPCLCNCPTQRAHLQVVTNIHSRITLERLQQQQQLRCRGVSCNSLPGHTVKSPRLFCTCSNRPGLFETSCRLQITPSELALSPFCNASGCHSQPTGSTGCCTDTCLYRPQTHVRRQITNTMLDTSCTRGHTQQTATLEG